MAAKTFLEINLTLLIDLFTSSFNLLYYPNKWWWRSFCLCLSIFESWSSGRIFLSRLPRGKSWRYWILWWTTTGRKGGGFEYSIGSKNWIIYNLINNKPISTPLSIGVFLRLFIYLKHIRNIMRSLLMEALKKLIFLMIFLRIGSGWELKMWRLLILKIIWMMIA